MTGLSPKPILSELRRALVSPPSPTPPAGSRVSLPCASPPWLLLHFAPKDCCIPREALWSQGRLHPCTALRCLALHPCSALPCVALHYTALHRSVLPCIALHCTAPLHCTPALHPCAASLRCIPAPHPSTALSCAALHSTAQHRSSAESSSPSPSLMLAALFACQQMELTTRLVPWPSCT